MSQMKRNTQRNEQTIKIVVDRNECFLELKLYPNRFFYPWLTYGPDDEYDHVCDRDDYISKEKFEKDKNKSVKIHKMFKDNKYKELFENKFLENIEAFLRQIEYEVEIEYEEFLTKKISIPESGWKIKKSLLDRYLNKNEDAIFEFLKEKGLYFLRNRTILFTIQKWSDEKNKEKLKKFVETLKEIIEVKPGPMPLAFEEEKMFIITLDPCLRSQIKKIKDKIESYDKEMRRDDIKSKKLISEYKKKRFWWFKYLEDITYKREGKGIAEFVKYFREKEASPRSISKKILAKRFKVSERRIEEVFRERERITKDLKERSLTDLVEDIRDIEYWQYY